MDYKYIQKLIIDGDYINRLLITDDIQQSYWNILISMIYSQIKKDKKVIFVSLDTTKEQVNRCFEKWDNGNLFIIDTFQRHFEFENFRNKIIRAITNIKDDKVLFLDCNSLFWFIKDNSKIFNFIKEITQLLEEKIVFLYHKDIAYHNVEQQLNYLSYAQIELQNYFVDMDWNKDFIDYKYLELHKKANNPLANLINLTLPMGMGKVVREKCIVEVKYEKEGIKNEFIKYDEAVEEVKKDNNIEETGISGLSFNLNLTDSQKEAKDQVVLPYLATNSNELQHVQLGTIHYHPDDNDDFDEDDPDDDLEI